MDMDVDVVSTQARCRELAEASSFYRLVYSEIEDVGWERLVRLSDDLLYLSFRILDSKKRVHIVEIWLDKSYPKRPPSIAGNVPHLPDLKWSPNSSLTDVVHQYSKHLEELQDFWASLENIDKTLWVIGSNHHSYSSSYRQINIGSDCYVMLNVDASDPRSLPECRFLGSDPLAGSLREKWRRNNKRWSKDCSFSENLSNILEFELPRPCLERNDHQLFECGICYAQFLPTDDELGANSRSETDYKCDNTSCGKPFHSICLVDWLQSITTTRRSYDILFGNCPYCSDPVAVKSNNKK